MRESQLSVVARRTAALLLLQFSACRINDAPAATNPCTDTNAAVPNQPHLAGGIPLTVDRLGPGCGTVRVSSGIPLPPGKLTAAQLGQLRIFVGGQEAHLYVEALKSTHTDGSLRSVLVQFDYTLDYGKAVPGEMVLGQARATSDIQKTTPGDAAAVVLPTDAAYLISTKLLGPTLTSASAAQISSVVQKYEDDFRTYADKHWAIEGAQWQGNYYDRALIYYAWWLRTGEVEFWKRGTAIALDYRTNYLEPNNYNSSAHWLQIDGIEAHYMLTGDEASRTAVGEVADKFNITYYVDNLSNLSAPMDNRMQARTLMAFLTAWKLDAHSDYGTNWGTVLSKALTDILASQGADGAYRWQQIQCGYNKPFMVGVLHDALIKYYESYQADARIQTAIQKGVDYMWSKNWNATAKAFVYLEGPCPGDDGGPAPDLNNLIVNGYAWMYARTGNTVYRDRADAIFAGGVSQAWLDGSKQFNQEYTTSFKYLAYRQ